MRRRGLSSLVVVLAVALAGGVAPSASGQGEDAGAAEPQERLFRETEGEAHPGPTADDLSVMPLSAVRSLPLEGDRESTDEIAAQVIPVRHDVPQPRTPILTLRYWRIRKGTFDEFYRLTTDGMWPYFEKLGARMVGTWRVVLPPGGREAGILSHPDYDEVYMLVRYASFSHWQATRRWARLGGNGPDWEKAQAASSERLKLVLDSWVTFLEGGLYEGGPFFTPALEEHYQLIATEGE